MLPSLPPLLCSEGPLGVYLRNSLRENRKRGEERVHQQRTAQRMVDTKRKNRPVSVQRRKEIHGKERGQRSATR